ncbi:DUF2785 domain-containing protein [Mammaliicoccus sciuri]|uniref:DUF2785 domain-containing protein n=1 Tax=Mammaliicoccus sciuri TaxID=1296 RepID=UPI001E5238BC|nr:DUF2785 domain-containing protein [Mammaliicoccus sciuri]MCD8796430.1 DUF2785 domain-containing protein [Mammaliicoccus sciuri]
MTMEGLIEKYKNKLPDKQVTEEEFKLMMSNIGNPNANIRENNFDLIARLIISGKLDNHQMLQLLEHCEFILGSVNQSDSEHLVLDRSFSALIIGIIVEYLEEHDQLPQDVYEKIINIAIEYMDKETDVRGYVQGIGWMHSVAHGSDLLATCVRSKYYSSECNKVILKVIAKKLYQLNTDLSCYIDDEDERQAFIIEALLEKGLTDLELSNWVSELFVTVNQTDLNQSEEAYLSYFRIRKNIKDFLKTLYFRLKFNQKCQVTQDKIEEILNKLYLELTQQGE